MKTEPMKIPFDCPHCGKPMFVQIGPRLAGPKEPGHDEFWAAVRAEEKRRGLAVGALEHVGTKIVERYTRDGWRGPYGNPVPWRSEIKGKRGFRWAWEGQS